LAMVGAGDMPIAILLICLTVISQNLIQLLNITSSRASSKAADENPYMVHTSGSERYPERQARQSAVSMLGYMVRVSYVNRLALGGKSRFLRSDFSSAEFLVQLTPLFQKAMVNAKAYLRRTSLDHLRTQSKKETANRKRVFLHLPYHPTNHQLMWLSG
jgi:hypothetical protein